MPWAAAGSAEQKEKVDLQRLCRYKPGSHLLSVLPVIRRLVAQVSGGIAQVWARFRLCVEPRARAACVSVRSPACLLSCKGCQQNCCCSRNRCRVVNWPLLWLEENRWAAKKKRKKKAPVWRPTCSCHHKTDSLAKAFSQYHPRSLRCHSLHGHPKVYFMSS